MTVLDSSAVVDFLLGGPAAADARRAMEREGEVAAPDVLAFEILAVLRRHVLRHDLPARRAAAAVADLGDLPLLLYPALSLRLRAWSLRANMTMADALFVALAERLGEPLLTKDAGLAAAAARHADVDVVVVPAPAP